MNSEFTRLISTVVLLATMSSSVFPGCALQAATDDADPLDDGEDTAPGFADAEGAAVTEYPSVSVLDRIVPATAFSREQYGVDSWEMKDGEVLGYASSGEVVVKFSLSDPLQDDPSGQTLEGVPLKVDFLKPTIPSQEVHFLTDDGIEFATGLPDYLFSQNVDGAPSEGLALVQAFNFDARASSLKYSFKMFCEVFFEGVAVGITLLVAERTLNYFFRNTGRAGIARRNEANIDVELGEGRVMETDNARQDGRTHLLGTTQHRPQRMTTVFDTPGQDPRCSTSRTVSLP